MKKSDIASIILIAGFSTVIAFVFANVLFGDPNEESTKVQYMDVISSEVAEPSQELFNAWAINPTVEVYVGQCGNNETWNTETKQCINSDSASDSSADEGEDEEGENADEPTPEE